MANAQWWVYKTGNYDGIREWERDESLTGRDTIVIARGQYRIGVSNVSYACNRLLISILAPTRCTSMALLTACWVVSA